MFWILQLLFFVAREFKNTFQKFVNTFFWRKHDVRLFCQFRLKQFVGLSADPPSQEHVPRHDGHASRVDRAKDAVLEQLNLKNKDKLGISRCSGREIFRMKVTAALEGCYKGFKHESLQNCSRKKLTRLKSVYFTSGQIATRLAQCLKGYFLIFIKTFISLLRG